MTTPVVEEPFFPDDPEPDHPRSAFFGEAAEVALPEKPAVLAPDVKEAPPAIAGVVSPSDTASLQPQTPTPFNRQRQEYLEQIERQFQQQQVEQRLQQAADQYQRELEADGFMPEQARRVAIRHYQVLKEQVAERQAVEERGRHSEGKRNAAEHYGQKYQVSPQTLMSYDSPEAMEAAAQEKQRLGSVEAELTRLKRQAVQPQRFAGSAGPGVGRPSREHIRDAYIRGERDLTTEEARQLGII